MYSQIASQTFHINKYKSERTKRTERARARARNAESRVQNAIQLSAHNKCQWWGGHYKHKNVLNVAQKISLKNFARRGERVLSASASASSSGVFRSRSLLLLLSPLLLRLPLLPPPRLTAIECGAKWQCVRRRFAFAICNNQSMAIKI